MVMVAGLVLSEIWNASGHYTFNVCLCVYVCVYVCVNTRVVLLSLFYCCTTPNSDIIILNMMKVTLQKKNIA